MVTATLGLSAVGLAALAACGAGDEPGGSALAGSPGLAGARVLAATGSPTRTAYLAPDPAKDGRATVVVVEGGDGKSHTLGEPDSYAALRWSPDGSMLAAVAPREPGSAGTLRLFDASGGVVTVDLPAGTAPMMACWSPDGTRLAVIGQRVSLFDRTGALISRSAGVGSGLATAVAGARSTATVVTEFFTGGYGWSADSRRFGALIGADIVTVEAAGATRTVPITTALSPSVSPGSLAFDGWNETTLILAPLPGRDASSAVAWVVDVAAGFQAHAVSPDSVATPGPPRNGCAVGLRATGVSVAGGQVFDGRRTADGAADLCLARTTAPGTAQGLGSTSVLVAVHGDRALSVVELPRAASSLATDQAIDAVVEVAR